MRRGMRTLGDALSSVTSKMDRHGALPKARVVDAWYRVVGEDVSSHTMGIGIQNGRMVVFVDHHVWAQELNGLSKEFKERLNEDLGEELVREMRFIVSKEVAREQRRREQEARDDEFYEPDGVTPVPLSEAERRQVEHSAAVIEDEELREAAIRATIADLEMKKGARVSKRS